MNRTAILLLAAVLVIAGLLSFVNAVTGTEDSHQLVLSEVHGVVRLTSLEGNRKAKAGAVLSANDRIATTADSRVVLTLNESRIRVGPNSSIAVRGVSEEGVHLELENGVLEVTVRPSGAVRVANRGVQVISTQGEFAVGADGKLFEVNVTEGEVLLQGINEASRLLAGEGVRVDGAGHAEIGLISDDLLLEVQWPTPGNKRTVWVSGRTEPTMMVKVRGARGELASARADPKGHFTIQLQLEEGEQEYTVVAVNPLGREQKVSELIKLDTTGPTFRGGSEYRR